MPPKKKGKKKKDGPNEDADKVELLNNKVNALIKQLGNPSFLVYQKQHFENTKASQNQIRQRVIYLEKDLKSQKERLKIITSAMTQQYKQMQQELTEQICRRNQVILQKQLEQSTISFKENQQQLQTKVKKEHQQQIKGKDVQQSELKKKIQQMSVQFAAMLNDTLSKVQEKINQAQWEKDSQNMMKRIQQKNN